MRFLVNYPMNEIGARFASASSIVIILLSAILAIYGDYDPGRVISAQYRQLFSFLTISFGAIFLLIGAWRWGFMHAKNSALSDASAK